MNNEKELLFFSEYISDPIIEEYLPGPEITNDVICDLDGKLLGVVSRRRIEVRCGEVSKGVTLRDERITAACAVIGEALPAIGPVTVQCMMKDGIPHFTEINAGSPGIRAESTASLREMRPILRLLHIHPLFNLARYSHDLPHGVYDEFFRYEVVS